MNKWGVRLIGIYFFVWAISQFVKYVTITRNEHGFWGFDLGLAHNGKLIDVIGLMGVVILIFAGFQLLRFQASGRYSALFILRLAILASGIGIILTVAVLIDSLITGTSFPLTTNFRGNSWLSEPGGSIVYVVLLAGVFIIIYFIPAYYLMRKDVKQLFEKPVAAGETN
jgi:hypothetical protein